MAQQVFKLIFILSFFYSCSTLQNNYKTDIKQININSEMKDQGAKTLIAKQQTKVIDKSEVEYITEGSISTMEIIGSDLWIGKLGGELLRYNLYTKITDKFLINNYSIKDFSIKKIVNYKNYILILQSDRVIVFSKSDEKIKTTLLPKDIGRATDLIIYKNKVYISTLGYGIWEYNISKSQFLDFIPFIKYISSLYLDKDKLYIGTMDSGFYSYDLLEKKIESRLNYPLAVFNKNIVTINKKNNTIYLGTFKTGLIKWDLEENIAVKLLENESITSIFYNNNIFAVSLMGSGVYWETLENKNLESINTYLLTNNITCIKIFNNKLISGNIKKGVISQELIIK